MLSIVVPVFNESAGIEEFHRSLLLPAIKKCAKKYEIIYVNDGSSDDSLKKLQQIAKKNPTVRIVSLSRNFGKEIATTAGIFQATGDATIILDADGQHPPKLMPNFIKKWQAGAQIVVGVRKSNQKEGPIKKWGSKLFYKLLNSKNDTVMIPGSTDFRLIDKEVRKQFCRFSERNRVTRGLIDWLGYNRDYVYFNAPARLAGEATYNIRKLTKLALNSITSLSLKPLFFFGWVGGIIMVLSFLLGLFIIIEQFLMGDPLSINFSGPVMVSIFVAFLIGIVLISQAMLSTYISHIYVQTQDRPLFVINKNESIRINQD